MGSLAFPGKGQIEAKLLKSGATIAGVDEVGRGCLAGPVHASAVILDYGKLKSTPDTSKAMIRDSKTLSAKQRAKIIPVIHSISRSFAIDSATVREIENLGIVEATFLAMRRCLKKLNFDFDILLVDGHRPINNYPKKQKTVIKGDHLCYSIAAASILAKEARDGVMSLESDVYPNYGFDTNVGYGTKKHLLALKEYGITPLHRRNFSPVKELV